MLKKNVSNSNSSPKAKKPLLDQWRDYKKNINSYIEFGNTLSKKHFDLSRQGRNVAVPKDIEDMNDLLLKLIKIQENLKSYEDKILSALSKANAEKHELIDKELDDLQYYKTEISSTEIQLKKMLAAKYMYKAETSSNLPDKKVNVKTAWNFITAAVSKFEELKLGKDYDPDLLSRYEKITEKYASYFGDNNNNNKPDEIELILKKAEQVKDKDEAFALRQTGLDLARKMNNPVRQFNILCIQTKTYCVALSNEIKASVLNAHEIEKRLANFKKLYCCAEDALKLKKQNKNAEFVDDEVEIFCEVNLNIARTIIHHASNFISARDSENRLKFLLQAQSHCEISSVFNDIKDKEKKDKYDKLLSETSNSIKAEIECIQKKKAEAESEAILLTKLKQEYNAAFEEKLKEWPSDDVSEEELTGDEENNNQSNTNENNVQSADIAISGKEEIAESDIPIEEMKLIEGVYIKEKIPPQKNLIDLNTTIKKLETAKKESNLVAQVTTQATLGEYYRKQALISEERRNIPALIEMLRVAIGHLEEATRLTNQIKCSKDLDYDHADLLHKEGWNLQILTETQALLTKILQQQESLAIKYRKSSDYAQRAIIQQHGRDAWFKFESIDRDKLSPPAQRHWDIEENIEKLKILETKIKVLFQAANPTESNLQAPGKFGIFEENRLLNPAPVAISHNLGSIAGLNQTRDQN